MVKKSILLISFWGVLTACGTSTGGHDALSSEPKAFKPVAMPSMLTTPEERGEYMMKHYWDQFDFTDTSYVNLPDVTEQAFVDYINMFPYVAADRRNAGIETLYRKAEVDSSMFVYFTELGEKYLYDPNSPFRNDEFYIPILQIMLTSKWLTEEDKIRPKDRLELALKNRPGEKAVDFSYTLGNGQTSNLYSLKADYLILYFNHPECPACRDIREGMRQSPLLNEMIQRGKLKILALFSEDDVELWKKHRADIPANWINAYDKQHRIRGEKLYDLKASPTIYLLDVQKNVILKDAPIEQVAEYLNYNTPI